MEKNYFPSFCSLPLLQTRILGSTDLKKDGGRSKDTWKREGGRGFRKRNGASAQGIWYMSQ